MGRYKEPFTIFKRGKYWYYRTYDADGIRTTAKSTGQANKTLALEYCNDLFKSDSLLVTNQTFFEYAANFLDDESTFVKDRTAPLSANSLRAYRGALKNHLMPTLKNIKLKDINYSFLKRFRMNLMEKLRPNSMSTVMWVFEKILESALKDGLLNKNPFQFLESVSITERKRDAFSYDEVITVYRSISDNFKNLIMMMALTGMRISETVGVEQKDIIEENGFCYIDLHRQFERGAYKLLKTKDQRFIPIIPELKDHLFDNKLYIYNQFYEDLKSITKSFNNAENRLLSSHSIRHFFITNTKAANINPMKIEKIAGHKFKGMEQVYTNFRKEDLNDILIWQKKTFNSLLKK